MVPILYIGEVKCHGADAQSSKPDADYRPWTKQEVQRAAVVKGSILEDETTKVAVSRNDIVSLFFLTEFVTVVLGLRFSRFTN